MTTDDLEASLQKHMKALRDSLPPPPGLERQVMGAVRMAQKSRRRSFAYQFVLTTALVLFVGAVAVEISVLRWNREASPAITSPEKPSLMPAVSPTVSPKPLSPQSPLARIAFLNPEVGVIAYDGVIKLTGDSGKSWRVVKTGAFVRQLQWLDHLQVAAATTKGLFMSSDGGLSWNLTSEESDVNSISFTSPSVGFAASHGQLFRTTDGGRSFTAVATGINVQAVTFVDARRGWVAGPNGIAGTTNGGDSWTGQTAFKFSGGATDIDPYSPPTWSIGFADEVHGFVLYASQDTTMSKRASYVFYTSNGGLQWKLQSYEHFFPVPEGLPSPAGMTPENVVGEFAVTGVASAQVLQSDLASGQGLFLARTSDGGQAWKTTPLPSGPHAIAIGGQIEVIGYREWVIWTDGVTTSVAMSLDGGQKWATIQH